MRRSATLFGERRPGSRCRRMSASVSEALRRSSDQITASPNLSRAPIAEDNGFVSIEKARRELGWDPGFRIATEKQQKTSKGKINRCERIASETRFRSLTSFGACRQFGSGFVHASCEGFSVIGIEGIFNRCCQGICRKLNRVYESSSVIPLKSCAQSKFFVAILACDDWCRSFSDSLRSVSLAPTLRFMKEKPTSAQTSSAANEARPIDLTG